LPFLDGGFNKLGRTVTIRLNTGKEYVYDEFKDNVINKQHSDVCYVLTCIMESYNKAVANIPDPDSKVTMEFMKQTVQINIGCNFNYNTKKARRLPPETIRKQKNYFLPLVLDEWDTLSEKQKNYIRQQLAKEGIIPSVSNGTKENRIIKFFKSSWSIVKHLFARLF